jgi:hypothetical protein
MFSADFQVLVFHFGNNFVLCGFKPLVGVILYSSSRFRHDHTIFLSSGESFQGLFVI